MDTKTQIDYLEKLRDFYMFGSGNEINWHAHLMSKGWKIPYLSSINARDINDNLTPNKFRTIIITPKYIEKSPQC